MKKQSGFTLIELMVVMAIIAILATAGLAAYTGYIKKARDTTRIADLDAISTIVLATMSASGRPPQTVKEVYDAVTAANNAEPILDPQYMKDNCLKDAGTGTGKECGYTYRLCDAGQGYAVGARFESSSNASSLYAADDITVEGGTLAAPTGGSMPVTDGYNDADIFEIGSCQIACSSVAGGVDTALLCTSATTDPIVPMKLWPQTTNTDGALMTSGFANTDFYVLTP